MGELENVTPDRTAPAAGAGSNQLRVVFGDKLFRLATGLLALLVVAILFSLTAALVFEALPSIRRFGRQRIDRQRLDGRRHRCRDTQRPCCPSKSATRHGFQRPINNLALMMAAEKFLAEHLGGRYQEGGTPEEVARLKEISVEPKTVVITKRIDPASVSLSMIRSM